MRGEEDREVLKVLELPAQYTAWTRWLGVLAWKGVEEESFGEMSMSARELCIFGRSVSSRRTRSSQNVQAIGQIGETHMRNIK